MLSNNNNDRNHHRRAHNTINNGSNTRHMHDRTRINRIVNIHPSLLPKFGGQGMYGLRVHKAVLEAGEIETGATVHLIGSQYDEGPILQQATVPVYPGDTPEALQLRVLDQEHQLYPDTLAKIARGEIELP